MPFVQVLSKHFYLFPAISDFLFFPPPAVVSLSFLPSLFRVLPQLYIKKEEFFFFIIFQESFSGTLS